jgi:hypothetical protein
MIYRTCSDLPLIRFIRCICDDDLQQLVIEGDVTENELVEGWQAIYQEYIELSGTTANDFQATLAAEISQLFYRHTAITEAVGLSRQYRYDEVIDMLKKEGYNFPFNHNEPESYHRDLDRVLNRSKTLLIQREQKEAQMAKLQEGQQGGKITRIHFDNRLNALSIHYKHHINEHEISVSRYVGLLNQYFKDCEKVDQHARIGR